MFEQTSKESKGITNRRNVIRRSISLRIQAQWRIIRRDTLERSKLALAWCKGRGGERRETASTCERGQMIFAINGRPGWGIASIGLPETVPGDDVNARRPRRPSRRRRWLDYSPNRMKKRDSSRGPPSSSR